MTVFTTPTAGPGDLAFVYCTDDPRLLGIYRRAVTDRDALHARLDADLRALGGGPDIVGCPGGDGYPDEFTAIGQRGQHLPDGWAAAGRGQLRPIIGPAGDPARRWLAEHRPADPRHELAAHGLPRQVRVPCREEPGSYQIVQVELREHDGVLWARYPAEPAGPRDVFGIQPCTWTRREPGDHPATAGIRQAASR